MAYSVRQIVLLIGSLRADSYNRKVAQYIRSIAPDYWQVSEVEIADLPIYNQDFDDQPIEVYERVRGQIAAADAVLFITPEHNRSVPAALKNVVDIVSRPAGRNVWAGKKAAVVTASTGSYGGINAGVHLRQILQMLGVTVLVQPEVYLTRIQEKVDELGVLNNERTQRFLQQFVHAFDRWLGL